MKVSIIIPTYNEAATLAQVIEKVLHIGIGDWEREVIVVDDGSFDDTYKILTELKNSIVVLNHKTNKGKGAAIKTGIEKATGDYVLIQDADMEYDPQDIPRLLLCVVQEQKDRISHSAVYGNRGIRSYPERGIHYVIGAKLLTWAVNILYGSNIQDLYTGYKLIPTDILKKIDIHAQGFEFEAEVTCKLLISSVLVYEVPITYKPRNKQQGKKIRFLDAIRGFVTIISLRY